ncbi:hypothetical protein, partial [Mesorhizobium sp.]|uniref:hypothetical protein n=1 Tax=Mesorhizobium sp. TaxID=1871066 RepID=UPI0025BD8D47
PGLRQISGCRPPKARANAAIVNGELSGDGTYRTGAHGTRTSTFQEKYRKIMGMYGYLLLRKITGN